jgi:UDP-N-acetylglucosamine--N-acetylmuramyl-(pentapeptide) pyrophosphoryl-undecaprenol N-acetylglucosamine transferase
MKILIPGGHLTPALAVIDFILANQPNDQIVFCGRLFSQDSTKQKSQEEAEITQRQIPFRVFSAPRWDYTTLSIKLVYPVALVIAVLRGLLICWQEKPDVLLSFGGYMAVPLALAATVLRIPIVTHEQTRSMGAANQFIAKLAKKVAVSFPESAAKIPAKKVVVTGNPLRTALLTPQPKPAWLETDTTRPIIYVTGGNQGSEIINVTIQQGLKSFVRDWVVIHQCGNPTQARHYREELEQAKSKLPVSARNRYHVREWLSETELGWIYQHASVVVSRAGANTVQELAVHHVPSILIPLPFAHGDEQLLNAHFLADVGGALILPQKELNPRSLHEAIQKVVNYQRSMSSKLAQLVVLPDAPAKLYQLLSVVTE